jgi:hypothetical protein
MFTKLGFELTMRMVVLLAINHAQLVRIAKCVELHSNPEVTS